MEPPIVTRYSVSLHLLLGGASFLAGCSSSTEPVVPSLDCSTMSP